MNTLNYHQFCCHFMTDQDYSNLNTVDNYQIRQTQKEKNLPNFKQTLMGAGLAPPFKYVVG